LQVDGKLVSDEIRKACAQLARFGGGALDYQGPLDCTDERPIVDVTGALESAEMARGCRLFGNV
jgi:hypothetical protein